MYIEGWSIDAFGALAETERFGIGPGLTVVHGPNEAGKSTLRHFVLGVLFGFPAGNTRYPRYRPTNGAVRSGRLHIVADGEPLVLSRVEKKGARSGESTLLGPDGKARSDAELTALLGGLTRGVYDRIFAVGLDELNDLAALTDGDLQDHLLSAGVTGAGRVATLARNDLRARAGTIHRARAQSTEVATIRERLRQVESRLADARRAARELEGRRDELDAARRRARRLAEEETAANRRVRRAERLGELWPAFLHAADAADELAALGPHEGPLAPDTADHLARALAALEAAEADLAARTASLERTLASATVLEAGHLPELAALQPDLARLQHRLSGWMSQEEEARARAEELDRLERRLARELDAVGVADTVELARIGKVVAARDQITATRRTFEEKSAARRLAADEVERQAREVIDAQAARDAATAAMDTVPEDLSAQSLRIESERAAREAMLLERLTDEVDELDRLRGDLAAHDGGRRRGDGAADAPRPSLEPRAVLVGLAVALAAAAVVAVVVAGIAAGIVLGVAAGVTGVVSRLLTGGHDTDPQDRARRELTAKIEFLERKCTDSAQMLGFTGVPSPGEVAAARVERSRQSATLTALVAADTRLSTVQAAMRAKKEQLADATRANERALQTWRDWLIQYRLPEGLRPEGVDDWLSHLDQARSLDDQVRTTRARRDALRSSLDEAPGAVRELVDRATRASRPENPDATGRPPTPLVITPVRADSTIGELQTVVAAVDAAVSEAVKVDQEVARVRDSVEVLRAERSRAVAARDAALADLDRLYGDAGVVDEKELRRRLADEQRRRDLTASIDEFERRLATESGVHADADREALEARTPEAWRDERAAALTEAQDLAARRDEVLRRVGALEADVAAVERSADLPTLALEREELVEELARAVRSWTVLHLAAGLIESTLDRYLDQRQPAVLQRAGTHLATITDGRYSTIRLDPESDGTPTLTVLDARDRPHAPGELSRGTVEQVYLCLRLALAEGHHQSLPLLLDDILVNFDPERAETTTRVLAQVATRAQVIVFTCHPWVVDVMDGVVDDLNRVDLVGPVR